MRTMVENALSSIRKNLSIRLNNFSKKIAEIIHIFCLSQPTIADKTNLILIIDRTNVSSSPLLIINTLKTMIECPRVISFIVHVKIKP